MNRIHRLTHITLFAAVVAAMFTVETSHAAGTPVRIIELPRVTVVAKRLPALAATRIVQLPRVLVTAKQAVASDAFVAQRGSRLAGV